MQFTKKFIEMAKSAKSADELIDLAKANGVLLSEEEGNKYYKKINTNDQQLADEEVENASGGWAWFSSGYTEMYCKNCDWTGTWDGYHEKNNNFPGPCPKCNATFIYAGDYHGC